MIVKNVWGTASLDSTESVQTKTTNQEIKVGTYIESNAGTLDKGDELEAVMPWTFWPTPLNWKNKIGVVGVSYCLNIVETFEVCGKVEIQCTPAACPQTWEALSKIMIIHIKKKHFTLELVMNHAIYRLRSRSLRQNIDIKIRES